MRKLLAFGLFLFPASPADAWCGYRGCEGGYYSQWCCAPPPRVYAWERYQYHYVVEGWRPVPVSPQYCCENSWPWNGYQGYGGYGRWNGYYR